MSKTTFDQLPMTNVSTTETEKLLAYAKSCGVMLYDFPVGCMPTKGSIDHCKLTTANGKDRVTYALYYSPKDGKVYLAMQRGNRNSKVVRDSKVPFTISEVSSELDWLLAFIGDISRPNMPFKACSEYTVKGNIVTMSLSNGQQFTLTIAEVKATTAK